MATLDQDDLDAIEALIAANNATLVDAVWDEPLTGAAHNVATSAGRRLRTLADTVVLKDGDTVAADNDGTINGENSLGRIKIQPDVGTVCVGQAVRVADQVRYIEEYDADTQYATVDSAWCSIPQVGDEYSIFNLRTSLIQKITSAASGTIAFVLSTLWGLFENVDGYRYTEKALEEAPTFLARNTMASLLSSASSNGAGTGASLSGPATVIVENDSVFDGATVHLEVSETDTAGKYAPLGQLGQLKSAIAVRVDVTGSYYMRAVVAGAGSSTSINAVVIQ